MRNVFLSIAVGCLAAAILVLLWILWHTRDRWW